VEVRSEGEPIKNSKGLNAMTNRRKRDLVLAPEPVGKERGNKQTAVEWKEEQRHQERQDQLFGLCNKSY